MVRNGHKLPKLKACRLRAGLTQEQLATQLGVNRATVAWLESSRSSRKPGRVLAEKVAIFTNRSIGQVMDEYEHLRMRRGR